MYNSKILEKENKRYAKVNGVANSSYTWHLNNVPKKILMDLKLKTFSSMKDPMKIESQDTG